MLKDPFSMPIYFVFQIWAKLKFSEKNAAPIDNFKALPVCLDVNPSRNFDNEAAWISGFGAQKSSNYVGTNTTWSLIN